MKKIKTTLKYKNKITVQSLKIYVFKLWNLSMRLVNFRPEYSRYGGETLFNDALKAFESDSKLALKTINMQEEKIKLLTIFKCSIYS